MAALVRRSPLADVITPPPTRAGRANRLFRNEITANGASIEDVFRRLFVDGGTGGETAAGLSVGSDSAMRCAAVFACVRVLAESVAQLPCQLFERTPDGGKKRRDDHTLAWLLNVAPNAWQTAFEFREMMMGHLALRGNAYAFKNRLSTGRLWELIPLHPDRVEPKQTSANAKLTFEYTPPDGGQPRTLQQDQVLHIRGLTSDGLKGINPITMNRESIGLALAGERHGARQFKNGVQPSGLLKFPGKLTDDAHDRLKADFEEKYASSENTGKVPILEQGLDFVKLGMTSTDAQWLENRKYQRTEIASIFRVPPHMIGDLERATFSNIEHQGLDFVAHSLVPWLVRWEQAIVRDLITPAEQGTLYVKFNVNGLQRGDIRTRYTAYGQGIKDGWLRRNEVRVLEDLDPADGLDEFLTPLNMATGPNTADPAFDPALDDPANDN